MSGTLHFAAHPRLPDVAVLTLSHPGKLNAISVAMWHRLREIFDGLAEREPRLRAVLLKGEGGQFAAGADIAEFPGFRFEEASLRRYHEHTIAPALHALLACDVPLVAQIEGACVGGGMEIAACCDLRIAGAGSRFGAPIARLGFPMAPDELAAVLRAAGAATAREMLLEGRLLDAATALQRGLVHRVVPDAEVAQEAERTLERIAALAPQAARINKQTLRRLQAGLPFGEAERQAHFRYATSADHREGVTSFLEGRPPVFRGE
ncbi:enoyl-CoA hydratase/isomerase family protein [Caldimonas thermodepolymerans]|jgi:Enoyl-CoA hydratase/carnithine racemase|uniref:Enoyl-CoA hydratase/carnithine racemase n=1 Tax=Caldimonas thermodepolymerans TaxID=215580 RepID=A0AA46DBQ0_9BURK|nr:enoyl-CoA hydratase-related protein [Caldimonas thermodepolymerans]TCP03180.1 enoyl-CoA hydratase/carnithine racemase [Caldimonas thermodepolymerans]UZG47982.1 enoyl-CoA hydratase-related protein [Caldimonas thermodepolymerans]